MLTFHRRIGDRHLLRFSFSDRSDGDTRKASFQFQDGKAPIFPHQVHGSDVSIVTEWGAHNKRECDALITKAAAVPIGIRVADCVPIAMYGSSPDGPVLAVVHAGWRGIRAGVVAKVAEHLGQFGCGGLRAIVGPHISVEEYEFGSKDLSRVVGALGEKVAGRTKDGKPALNLRAAVEVTLERNSVSLDHLLDRCTAQDLRYWSHRSRGDEERFSLVGEIRLL